MSDSSVLLPDTNEPSQVPVIHTMGQLGFEWIDGGVHAIRYGGVEVIRAVTFSVRDRDWGTIAAQLSEVHRMDHSNGLTLSWTATYHTGEGASLGVKMSLAATQVHIDGSRRCSLAPYETRSTDQGQS